MRGVCLTCLLVLIAGCRTMRPAWFIDPALDETVRVTTSGPVVGGAGKYGSHAWLGIPFARPPVGPLRWRAPQPPEPWTQRRAATHFGRACVQPASQILTGEEARGDVAGDEDCLTLNVWAPPTPAGKLPVMVWIHGGGNSLGSAVTYDLGHLATAQQVIGVTVQYRLGPLGYLRHAALRTGDADGDSGNFGTLDLIRALEWVRDNAEAFGGDPNNVTIFGESAGGQNVYALLLSPRAKGLFHRAIAQSPVLSRGTLGQAEHLSDHGVEPGHASSSNEAVLRLLQRDGSASTRDEAKAKLAAMEPAALAAYLRSTPADEIMGSYLSASAGGGLRMLEMPMVFGDGAVLPDAAWLDAFRKPGWNQVPVMLGTNKEEAKLFLFLNPKFTWRLFGVLPRMRDAGKYESASETMSRLWKARSQDAVAQAMVAAGSAPFTYRFDWAREPTRLGTDLGKMLGAAHAIEIPFVHGHFEGGVGALIGELATAERDGLSNAMMAYWAQFARTGRPGTGGEGQGLPEWPPYDPADGAPKFMTFDAAPPGLRMSTTVEHAATVVADLIADPRVPDLAEKCEGLRGLVKAGFLAPALIEADCP